MQALASCTSLTVLSLCSTGIGSLSSLPALPLLKASGGRMFRSLPVLELHSACL